ncbi:hypothetical protein PR048_023877 [Dryococelus australis]|uniref:Uncharacterized protein n=1 Tax=Dryococelus australis TaxID=614101 RepID=A0ABQ9GVD2_9NEOP|nr:hypothetical protein PR048_023877 [Dryococelus australis]
MVVRERCRFTISELSEEFPDISRSALYTIFTGKLGYGKHCARWVSKMSTDVNKERRMAPALTFLSRYADTGEQFSNQIVTGDESWIHLDNGEAKLQTQQRMHTHSPNKQEKV